MCPSPARPPTLSPIAPGYRREIIFLTDGGISGYEEERVYELVTPQPTTTASAASLTHVLSLGIGHGVHRGLLEEIGRRWGSGGGPMGCWGVCVCVCVFYTVWLFRCPWCATQRTVNSAWGHAHKGAKGSPCVWERRAIPEVPSEMPERRRRECAGVYVHISKAHRTHRTINSQ